MPAFYLLDTNILARLSEPSSPMHQTAAAVWALTARGNVLLVTSQNFVELWNLATRPAEKNGFGLTTT